MQIWRLELTALAKPSKTFRLMGAGPGLARPEAAGRVVGQVWNWTDLFLWFKPGLLGHHQTHW